MLTKKLNCQKSRKIKWQQPQDLTQPNTQTVHSKLDTSFEKKNNTNNNKTAISRQKYKVLKHLKTTCDDYADYNCFTVSGTGF